MASGIPRPPHAQYKQTVLNAFQYVTDSMTALDQDALTLQASQTASAAAGQSFTDIGARRLGAISYPITIVSEQRWQSAKLSEVQATATWLVDTAALFQAMGAEVDAGGRDLRREASR
jgi:outer membrane protein TolC